MRGPWATLAGFLGLLAAAAPAHAATIRAETVLPPGQSGFVSVFGVTSGTGSPHLYDQTALFSSFRWKPASFGQPGEAVEPRPGVRIVRDRYGVPAITATSEQDMWWGAGYAVAQDRLFQLELFRRATTGTLSEIVGRRYLDATGSCDATSTRAMSANACTRRSHPGSGRASTPTATA